MAKTPPDAETAVPDAGEDPPLEVGWFRFYFDPECWEWSPEAARIHGYETGPLTMTPSTAVVMAHKHPDDRARLEAHLNHVRRTHEPMSTRHRIIDAQGQTREVVVAGQELLDEHGTVIGTSGFYIDVTPSSPQEPSDDLSPRQQLGIAEAVDAAGESRTVIDQLKGMLMLIYGVGAEKALGLLKWRSQEADVTVHALAAQLTDDFLALSAAEQLPPRSRFDSTLLTAHLRVQVT